LKNLRCHGQKLFFADPFLRAVWDVPGLTQSVIDNGAMLVYARTNSDATVRIFPAMIVDQNNTDFEMYQNFATVNSFELFHDKVQMAFLKCHL
jgi:hypothetical protein